MERKRSVGVTILGVLTIIGGLLCLLVALDMNAFLKAYIKPFGIILYLMTIPLAFFQIVLGVNILKLREWARKYLVILTIAYFASTFLLPFIEDKNQELILAQDIQVQMQKSISQTQGEQATQIPKELPPRMVKTIKGVLYGACILLYCITIFFFTRPKVKEQFEQMHQ